MCCQAVCATTSVAGLCRGWNDPDSESVIRKLESDIRKLEIMKLESVIRKLEIRKLESVIRKLGSWESLTHSLRNRRDLRDLKVK